GSVRLYDLNTGQEQRLSARHKAGDPDGVPVPTGGVTALAFTPDGSTYVTAGGDDTLRQWDVADGKKRREFAWAEGPGRVLAVSPDGKTIALTRGDGVVRLLDATTGAEVGPQAGHRRGLLDLVMSPDGRLAVTTGVDQTIRIWDLAAARELRHILSGGSV